MMLYPATDVESPHHLDYGTGVNTRSKESPDPTLRLVAAARSGDREALNTLYERYWPQVLSVVRLRMGGWLRSKMDSQDIVQSVMMESLRSLDQFEYRSEGAFLHLLTTMVQNKIRDKADYLTAQKRNVAREAPADDALGALPGGSETPSVIVQKAEEIDRMEKALESLPPDQRELVIMNKLEGMTYPEIAEAVGKTPEAVRKALARSLAKLSSVLSTESA
jgi:RNA polymerase sigma-70 factor (ECF subfamily)